MVEPVRRPPPSAAVAVKTAVRTSFADAAAAPRMIGLRRFHVWDEWCREGGSNPQVLADGGF